MSYALQRQLKKLQASVDDVRARIKTYRSRLGEFDTKYPGLRARIDEVGGQLPRMNTAVATAEAQVAAIRAREPVVRGVTDLAADFRQRYQQVTAEYARDYVLRVGDWARFPAGATGLVQAAQAALTQGIRDVVVSTRLQDSFNALDGMLDDMRAGGILLQPRIWTDGAVATVVDRLKQAPGRFKATLDGWFYDEFRRANDNPLNPMHGRAIGELLQDLQGALYDRASGYRAMLGTGGIVAGIGDMIGEFREGDFNAFMDFQNGQYRDNVNGNKADTRYAYTPGFASRVLDTFTFPHPGGDVVGIREHLARIIDGEGVGASAVSGWYKSLYAKIGLGQFKGALQEHMEDMHTWIKLFMKYTTVAWEAMNNFRYATGQALGMSAQLLVQKAKSKWEIVMDAGPDMTIDSTPDVVFAIVYAPLLGAFIVGYTVTALIMAPPLPDNTKSWKWRALAYWEEFTSNMKAAFYCLKRAFISPTTGNRFRALKNKLPPLQIGGLIEPSAYMQTGMSKPKLQFLTGMQTGWQSQ